MNLDDKTLAALTAGTAQFILSLPSSEQLAAWRAFLRYAELMKR